MFLELKLARAIGLGLICCGPAFACNDSGQSSRAGIAAATDCGWLLGEVRSLGVKVSWPQCAQDLESGELTGVDPAHCRLLNTEVASFDACLTAAITDLTQVPDPNCPRQFDQVARGDVAFFVLSDRHPQLWEQVLPAEAASEGVRSYSDWVNRPGNRQRLAEAVRDLLKTP